MTAFFVPLVEVDVQEAVYDDMAAFVHRSPPEIKDRIYSITWMHDKVRWIATVGEQLKGYETVTNGRGQSRRQFEVPHFTTDTVLAIYPGVPYMIMHDNKSRIWNLPISANPRSISKFGHPAPQTL